MNDSCNGSLKLENQKNRYYYSKHTVLHIIIKGNRKLVNIIIAPCRLLIIIKKKRDF